MLFLLINSLKKGIDLPERGLSPLDLAFSGWGCNCGSAFVTGDYPAYA
jgi:hypothetical protein